MKILRIQKLGLQIPVTVRKFVHLKSISERVGLEGVVFTAGKSGKIPYGQLKKYYTNTVFSGTPVHNNNDSVSDMNKLEKLQFFYHPDHLGSSSFITDVNGEAYQHYEYMPYGELFVEQKGGTDQYTPYLFNGKELDEKTGLYYYGTRYYDPRTSIWLSVDPLMEKHLELSSYAYCANSPIVLVDPDGRDWYSFETKQKNKEGKTQTKTDYKYVEGQMSKKEMKEGGYTHLGKTYKNGNKYYSLFGKIKDLRTKEGQVYEKIDKAIIRHAEYTEESKSPSNYSGGEDFGAPATDFSMNNNEDFNIEYENSIFGVANLSKEEANTAYMKDWIGFSDQPKSLTGWGGSNEKLYHILFRTKAGNRQRDVIRLKYDKVNAMKILKMYYNLYPNLRPK